MARILVHVETAGGRVSPIAFELLAAARDLANGLQAEIEAVVIGPLADGEIAALGKAARILHVTPEALASYTPEAHSLAFCHAAALARPDIVLTGYTTAGLDLGPSLAAATNWPLVSYCTRLNAAEGLIEAESQIYGGKLTAATRTPLPAIVSIVPGRFDESAGRETGSPSVETITDLPSLDAIDTHFVSESRPDPDAVDLAQADRIVSVGRGIGGADAIGQAQAIATLLRAEIAGSRPVIDAGWLPKSRQVGKSGTRVRPKLYLALGISGAPEHLEGMVASDLIVAVNSDPNAPIFGVAHYGTTCDLFELLPALEERLKD